ncbi:MAG: hypothetical protein ACTSPJ_08670 [Candidatus Heimdallarchaeaceae archaeon]
MYSRKKRKKVIILLNYLLSISKYEMKPTAIVPITRATILVVIKNRAVARIFLYVVLRLPYCMGHNLIT